MKTKETINYNEFLLFFNNKTGKKCKNIDRESRLAISERLVQGYTKHHLLNTITNSVKDEFHVASENKHVTFEYVLQEVNILKYSGLPKPPGLDETKKIKQILIKTK